MKVLILIFIGLLVGGCGESKEEQSTETDENSNTPEKPVKELTAEEQKALRDSVVGEYEFKHLKLVYLENGVSEYYIDGKKLDESKWSIVDGEIHIDPNSRLIAIWRINADKSITSIATILDGKRTEWLKEEQITYKKIK